ncbi:MOSC domain-containing protein [Patulibacter americanus]|uniref:MOSC domain-containing protein n=1 Tax=Patulibacter americanus TaxID=588672 RepID=UPI0003B4FC77|nr:MOSC domain-containing protein [Patulibacter americanus]
MVPEDPPAPAARVEAVARKAEHGPDKPLVEVIELVEERGVVGDAHFGATVQHRSRARTHPTIRNLRQVHLLQGELLDELTARGFDVAPGTLGENVTTRGVDLLALPRGTVLRLGGAVLEVTGLRNPCRQLNALRSGLMQAVLDRDVDGGLVRRSGVMAVVLGGGTVRPGDAIAVERPSGPFEALEPV